MGPPDYACLGPIGVFGFAPLAVFKLTGKMGYALSQQLIAYVAFEAISEGRH